MLDSSRTISHALIIIGLVIPVIYGLSTGNVWGELLPFGVLVSVLIIEYPFAGFLTLGFLPLILDLLPDIPYFTSIAIPLGGLTTVAYLMKSKRQTQTHLYIRRFSYSIVLILALLFILWIVGTNPEAVYGRFGRRNWFLTFFQLIIYMWLASEMLNSLERHRIFMIGFVILATISALIGLQRVLAGTTGNSERSVGLAINANLAAFQYTVAFIFLNYLLSNTKQNTLKIVYYAIIIILPIAILSTVSRTGILLLGIAFLLLLFMRTSPGARMQRILIGLIVLAIVLTVSPIDFITRIESRFDKGEGNLIEEDERYYLWLAAIDMFQDYPIQGVGVGNYRYEMTKYYKGEGKYSVGQSAHNTYFNILAENGLVGLLIFLGMIAAGIKACWNSFKTCVNPDIKYLIYMWLIIWVMWIINAMSGTTQYDKFSWLLLGVSIYLGNLTKNNEGRSEPC
jgi:O-antigen ligase